MEELGHREKVTLVTLGPAGTCHERAAREYKRFQGVANFVLELVDDLFEGLERIRGIRRAFLLQCSAHPLVHEITERHRSEIFVVDTFLYPTKPLAVLGRRDVERPRTLGLVPAAAGYIDPGDWEEIFEVSSKPVVAAELLAGRYDAGLTHSEHAVLHPELLRVEEEVGEVDTTWILYGTEKRLRGDLIGIPPPPSCSLAVRGPGVARRTGPTQGSPPADRSAPSPWATPTRPEGGEGGVGERRRAWRST